MNAKVASVIMLLVFFAVMIAVGFITRKRAASVDGFVLGGRTAGPWITAFVQQGRTGTSVPTSGLQPWLRL